MEVKHKKLRVNQWSVMVSASPDADEFVELCCSDHKESNPGFTPIKCSRSTEVYHFEWAGRTYFYKEYLFQNFWKHRKIIVRGMHLQRIANQLLDAGLKTPRIVCFANYGRRVFVVSEAVEDCCTVSELFLGKAPVPLEKADRFRDLFGQEVGRLHAAGFVHGDLRWGNVLVQHANMARPVFWFIDNDRTKKYRKIPARLRLMNLAQIKFTTRLRKDPESDWEAIWQGYLKLNPEMRKDANKWLMQLDRKLNRRIKLWWKKHRNRHVLKEQLEQERQTP